MVSRDTANYRRGVFGREQREGSVRDGWNREGGITKEKAPRSSPGRRERRQDTWNVARTSPVRQGRRQDVDARGVASGYDRGGQGSQGARGGRGGNKRSQDAHVTGTGYWLEYYARLTRLAELCLSMFYVWFQVSFDT